MARRVRQTVLRLDSRYRSAGTNNEPKFFLEQRLTNVTMVELRKVMMPNTDYPVHAGNNTFLWEDQSPIPITSVIPPGNYTAAEYAATLSAIMTADATDGQTYTIIEGITPQDSGRFVLTHTGATPIQITGGTSLPMNGFAPGQASVGSTIIAENVFDVSGDNYILIRSHELVMGSPDFSHFSDAEPKVMNTTNVLETVYKTGNFGQSILTDYNTKLRQPFHGILSGIELSLTYPSGSPVDLNGRPWMVELRVRHLR